MDADAGRHVAKAEEGSERSTRRSAGFALLVIVCCVSILAVEFHFFQWLDGRTNGRVPGAILNLLMLLTAFLLSLGLVFSVVKAGLLNQNRRGLFHRTIVVIATLALWGLSLVAPYSIDAFRAGLTAWLGRHASVPAVCRWAEGVQVNTDPTPAPPYWPMETPEEDFGIHVPPEAYSAEVASLTPDEVRLLPSGVVVMGWRGGFASWGRFAVFCGVGAELPAPLRADVLSWSEVRPGLLAVVYDHP